MRVAGAELVSRGAAVGGFVAFAILGLLSAVYGPAIPELREDFDVSAAVAGLTLSAVFAGGLTGTLVSGALDRRVALRRRLPPAAVCLALGAAGLAGSPTFALVVVSSFAIGLGGGAIDVGYSTLFASGFGRRSGSFSNLLHACFGLGAVLGPILVGTFSDLGFRPFVLGGAAVALALVPLTLVVRDPAPHGGAAPTARQRSPGLVLAGFVLLFFLYTGTETSVGGWEPTHLQALGHPEARAATLTAAFWGALTLGRMAGVALSLRVAPQHLASGATLIAAAGLGLAQVEPAAPVGYALAGFAFGPFFPTGLVWLVRTLPATRGATAAAVAAANVGAVAISACVGVAVTLAGPEWIARVLLGFGALITLTALVLAWATGSRSMGASEVGRGGSPGLRGVD
jgi:fucose permease